MKVAISMSVRADVRPPDFLRQNYVIYLESLGLLPVPTPNMLSDLHAWLDALGIEGVVLSGGGDIGPDAYGQPNNGAIEVHRERDRTEWGLLDWAIAHRRPVLGICRGIQVLNVYFGGQLIQDLPSHNDRFIAHDGSESHAVRLTDPRVAALLGTDTMDVNTGPGARTVCHLPPGWPDRGRVSPRTAHPRRAVAPGTPHPFTRTRPAAVSPLLPAGRFLAGNRTRSAAN